MSLHRSRRLQAGLLLLVAFATRAWLFGNPVIHTDEQFYLLVGDRMLQGAWPFVDIFDRKPVGLFLIFAGVRWIGGDGVLGYQIAATLVAAATAFLVTRIATRYAAPGPALLSGVFYLVWLVVFDGVGGQSSVWQNLLIAAAALLAFDAAAAGRKLTRRGTIAMLLIGCAMQVKYVALFDGVFLGLMLLWAGWKAGRPPLRLVAIAALWIAAALLPTALAWGVYAWAGRGDAFFYANFVSIFGQRTAHSPIQNFLRLSASVALALPLVALVWAGRRRAAPVVLWCAATATGIALMGSFEQHYFLPLALPLSAAAAGFTGGRRRRLIPLAVLLTGVIAAAMLVSARTARRGGEQGVNRIAALIGQRPARCLFVYDSDMIFYYLSHSCLPTTLAFRGHLGQAREAHGVPIDPVVETARILAARPGVIVMREHRPATNADTARLVDAAVTARYRPAGTVRLGRWTHTVYRLRTDAR